MKTLYILTLSILIIASCKKTDSTSPSFTVFSPKYGAYYDLGDTIKVDAIFQDNVELSSYSVVVGNRQKDTVAGFNFSDMGAIKDNKHNYFNTIIIPNSLTDTNFYIHFNVKDIDGNEASKAHLINLN